MHVFSSIDLVGQLTVAPKCTIEGGVEVCVNGRDAYFPLQLLLSVLGCAWISFMGLNVKKLEMLPRKSWLVQINDSEKGHKGTRQASSRKSY